MKYALLFLLIVLSSIPSSYARSIKSFNDSQALMTVAQFMMDSAPDQEISKRISDKKLTIKDSSRCIDVDSSEVIAAVESAIFISMRFYPDEELPIDEAMADLKIYLNNDAGPSLFKKCSFNQEFDHHKMMSLYFFDSKNQKHIKVDTITLLPE